MGRNPDETKPIKELADKLGEWAKRIEPKLPAHIGHISFYGSLLKALGNLPDLMLTFLRSHMPEQLDSIQKDLDDLYEKAKAVDHERSESGGEANILKCQAQAAATRLARKLSLMEGIVESHREQIEIREKPATTDQNTTPAKDLPKELEKPEVGTQAYPGPRRQVPTSDADRQRAFLGGYTVGEYKYAPDLPRGETATKQNTAPAKWQRTWTCVKEIPRWIYYLVGFLAALLTCLYLLGWLKPN